MPRSMRLQDVSDREFLALAHDTTNGDGQFSTAELAEAFGMDTKHPLTNVGVRLGYLRRIGMLERDLTTMGWYLTVIGERFVKGGLTKAQRTALDALKTEGAAWAATESLARLLSDTSATQATMMRRQWQYGWAQRQR